MSRLRRGFSKLLTSLMLSSAQGEKAQLAFGFGVPGVKRDEGDPARDKSVIETATW